MTLFLQNNPQLPLTLSVCQVKNAMLAGAKGIIMFSDPADYWADGIQVGILKSHDAVTVSTNNCN